MLGVAAQAQEALERRRLERLRMDELMRNPTQQPATPKKNILRKGAGAVMRVPAVAAAHSPKQAYKPPASAPAATEQAGHDRPDLERQRREWSEGLKQYIARQRETLKTAPDGKVKQLEPETAGCMCCRQSSMVVGPSAPSIKCRAAAPCLTCCCWFPLFADGGLMYTAGQ
jgi:hypothetical protein